MALCVQGLKREIEQRSQHPEQMVLFLVPWKLRTAMRRVNELSDVNVQPKPADRGNEKLWGGPDRKRDGCSVH